MLVVLESAVAERRGRIDFQCQGAAVGEVILPRAEAAIAAEARLMHAPGMQPDRDGRDRGSIGHREIAGLRAGGEGADRLHGRNERGDER